MSGARSLADLLRAGAELLAEAAAHFDDSGEVTISEAAGAPATLQGLLVAVSVAVVLVLPPLIYLLRLTQSEAWANH